MDLGIIITGAIGIITTFCSGLFTYLFSKRKYNAEVDSKTLENLSDAMQAYDKIVHDLNLRLTDYMKLSEENRVEVVKLKGIVYRLISKVCTDGKCTLRQSYTEEEVKEILGLLDDETDIEEDNN